jgi:hypothetical protein
MTNRIAMWSGPRNLSTAMMYAFGARGDCRCWDEPFYAAYLAATGLDHPMRDQVIAAGETDPARVASACLAPVPEAVFYQKHMTLHMIPAFDRGFMAGLTHAFLIRHPARVIASYAAKREAPTLPDIGFVQQWELFDQVCQMQGAAPPVIDSAQVRADPGPVLTALCGRLGIPFTDRMLSWPPGPKPYDGVWGPHWYGAVHASTGFGGAEGPLPVLEGDLAALCAAALPWYERMLPYL